jgi:hypothetical protein
MEPSRLGPLSHLPLRAERRGPRGEERHVTAPHVHASPEGDISTDVIATRAHRLPSASSNGVSMYEVLGRHRRLIPRKRVAELFRGPGGGWMGRHAEMNDSATLVREDDEHEQESARGRRDDEKVCGGDLPDVIGEEGASGLRGRCGRSRDRTCSCGCSAISRRMSALRARRSIH